MPSRPNKNRGGGGGNGKNHRGRGGGSGRNNNFTQFNHHDRVSSGRVQSHSSSFNRGNQGNGFRTRGNSNAQFGLRGNNIGNTSGANNNNSNGSFGYNDQGGDQAQGLRSGLLPSPPTRTFMNHGAGVGAGPGAGPLSDAGTGVYGRMEADGSFTPINPQQLFGQMMHSTSGHGTGSVPGSNRGRFGMFQPKPPLLNSQPGTAGSRLISPSSSPQLKNQLCKFHRVGGCANRIRCLYMHEEFPCKFYHVRGECGEKSNCKLSHEALTSMKRNILVTHIERGSESPSDGFPRMTRTDILSAIDKVALERILESSAANCKNANDGIASAPNYVDKGGMNHLVVKTIDGQNQEIQNQQPIPIELRILSETTKTIPVVPKHNVNSTLLQNGTTKTFSPPAAPTEPSVHQVIQTMRRILQQNEENNKRIQEKLEKENQARAPTLNSGRSSSSPSVQRISRTRPSMERSHIQLQVQVIPRSRNQQPGQGKGESHTVDMGGTHRIIRQVEQQHQTRTTNTMVTSDIFLTPADQDERLQLPFNSPPKSIGQLLPFAQTHLDSPVPSTNIGFLPRQLRTLPTIDDVISSCVGHGPPYTIWQTCQIYNTCAHHGLQVSFNDFSDFQDKRVAGLSHY